MMEEPVNVIRLREKGAEVGSGVFIAKNVYTDEGLEELLTIGDGAVISHGVTILLHDSSLNNLRSSPIKFGKVEIGENAYIGANATILCGTRIGKGALVGACSLVTKDVPDGMVVYGVPANEVSRVEELNEKYVKGVADDELVKYWDTIPWREKQKTMTPTEEEESFKKFILKFNKG